jgi:hypothetical protein
MRPSLRHFVQAIELGFDFWIKKLQARAYSKLACCLRLAAVASGTNKAWEFKAGA